MFALEGLFISFFVFLIFNTVVHFRFCELREPFCLSAIFALHFKFLWDYLVEQKSASD